MLRPARRAGSPCKVVLVSGRKVQAVSPPTRLQAELRPAETEVEFVKELPAQTLG